MELVCVGRDTLRLWDFANGLILLPVPPKATFLRSIRFIELHRSCGIPTESSLRLSAVDVESVSVGMERWCAVVGDLEQSESA